MKEENTVNKLNMELSLDEDFDPLEDLDPDEEESEEEVSGYVGNPDEVESEPEIIDDRPAEERIQDLFMKMAPRRKILLGTLAFCQEAQEVSAFND